MSGWTLGATVISVAAFGLAVVLAGGAGDGSVATAAGPGAGSGERSAAGYALERLEPSEIERRAQSLDPLERRIIIDKGTEPSFSGALVANKADGTYLCRLCGLPLFASSGKFESGTGWPSFFTPFDPDHVATEADGTLGMTRTEILCRRCNGHLGHVFDDGPAPTGQRYCVNSASLEFHPADRPLPERARPVQIAYFAGGCFWGIEDRFQQIPGVLDAVSGYQGGATDAPTYKEVCSGRTGHAESVRVTYDPGRVTYDELLEWFFAFHDPTQVNRQGWDVGTQYRSAIFTTSDDQLARARSFIERQRGSERFEGRTIATEVKPAPMFHPAEDYHQDYHLRHGGSCPLPTR